MEMSIFSQKELFDYRRRMERSPPGLLFSSFKWGFHHPLCSHTDLGLQPSQNRTVELKPSGSFSPFACPGCGNRCAGTVSRAPASCIGSVRSAIQQTASRTSKWLLDLLPVFAAWFLEAAEQRDPALVLLPFQVRPFLPRRLFLLTPKRTCASSAEPRSSSSRPVPWLQIRRRGDFVPLISSPSALNQRESA